MRLLLLQDHPLCALDFFILYLVFVQFQNFQKRFLGRFQKGFEKGYPLKKTRITSYKKKNKHGIPAIHRRLIVSSGAIAYFIQSVNMTHFQSQQPITTGRPSSRRVPSRGCNQRGRSESSPHRSPQTPALGAVPVKGITKLT